MRNFLSIILFAFSISAMAQNNIPDPPKFQSVSVIPESSPVTVRLTWLPSDSTDVAGYVVYKIVDNITVTIDSVRGRQNTSYEYTNSSANTTSERFRLAAYNINGYKSTITDPHSTILLSYSLDTCEYKATLTWPNYINWGTDIASYRVYRRLANTGYQLINTLPTDTHNEYADENLTNGTWYCYYIEAVRNDGTTATSNSVDFIASGYEGPMITANYASVNENQNIALNFQIANYGEVTEYHLLKSINSTENFSTIEIIPYTGQTQITYTDRNVDVSRNIYYYKLVSIHPCGQISKSSNTVSNILLKFRNNRLEWSECMDWPYGVISYKVFKYINGRSYQIGSTDPGQLTFSNNLDTIPLCYFVEAYENCYDISQQNVSRSNFAYSNNSAVESIDMNAVSLYPNPANEQFFIDGQHVDIIRIYSATGNLVSELENIGEERITINCDGWNPGLYNIRIITTEGKTLTRKIAISR